MMNRRDFLRTVSVVTACFANWRSSISGVAAASRKPSFVVIYTDDQGYNDLGCFGSPLIKTPRLDRMAAEGMKFTDFYSAASVCTPSRAALMTGCYPQRVGMAAIPKSRDGTTPSFIAPESAFDHNLRPKSRYGLNPEEITIPKILKAQGYATACIGKWHLGDRPEFLPTRNGFDSYFGIPYSNDMRPGRLMRDEKNIEFHEGLLPAAVQDTLTERYTEEAVRFITKNRDRPFFLYLPHTMPHTPLHVTERFRGTSARGLYGDAVECIDWSVGRVLDTLAELGLERTTLVIFASDNGPWYPRGENGGNSTPLRAAKGTTYEGGMRVPCIMRWPGTIPAGKVCSEVATTMDILPTLANLAGAAPPADRIIDGKDILPLMTGQPGATTPHEAFYYYYCNDLHAVRSGQWKLKFETTLHDEDIYQRNFSNPDATIPEALYNLYTDPGEQKSVLKDHSDIVARLRALAQKARTDLGDASRGIAGSNVRPIGRVKYDAE